MRDICGEGGFETSWSTLLRVALVLLALVISTPGLAQFAGGEGSLENPWQIATPAQFDELRNYLGTGHADKHFVLTSDIDLWAYSDGAGWVPVGEESNRFSGHLDGDGHVIRNLVINRPEADYQGLFGYLDGALIRRLGVENVDLQGGHFTGGVAGQADASLIDQVQVTGAIRGADNTGALVGQLDNAQLIMISIDAAVEGNLHTGGVAGRIQNASALRRVGTLGSVTASGEYAGGLAGRITGGVVTDSYSRAAVSGTSRVGGLVGQLDSGSAFRRVYTAGAVHGTGSYVSVIAGLSYGSIGESYCDLDSSGQPSSSHCVGNGSTTAEMQQRETYPNWNFFGLWRIDQGNAYPVFQDLSHHELPQAVDLNDLEGNGTEGDPWIITTADELNAMRQDLAGHYRLGNDIDLAASVVWNGGRGWAPVGDNNDRFTGSLDGAGFIIRNLTISRSEGWYQGLFGYLQDALIRDLGLEDISVWGGTFTGALSGYAAGTSVIERIEGRGEVTGTASHVGGLLGYLNSNSSSLVSSVHYSRFAGMVRSVIGSSRENTGGLVGWAGYSHIAHSHSTGFVEGAQNTGGLLGAQGNSGGIMDSYSHADVRGSSRVGGLVGRLYSLSWWPFVRYSYSTGSVTGSSSVGGLVGSSNSTITDSYWDIDTSGQVSSAGGLGRTTAEMLQRDTYRYWNFFTLWHIDEGQAYPVFHDLSIHSAPAAIALNDLDGSGTLADPWIIITADDLNAVRQDLAAHYRLGNDIDLSASVAWDNGRGWIPIGWSAGLQRFTGSLDGDGHGIRNLAIGRPEKAQQGLFGYLDGATISNLALDNVSIRGTRDHVGALAGRTVASAVDAVEVTGEIVGNNQTGGLLGLVSDTTLARSHAVVSVRGSQEVGGLVGQVSGSSSAISHSYTLGSVHGTQRTVGGVAGLMNFGSVSDSYSRASVSSDGIYGNGTGGLIGRQDGWSSSVSRAYSTGAVAGAGDLGGLVGMLSDGTVTDSYWDTETSGKDTSAGGTGKTTAEMQQQSTFVDWDFAIEPVWSIEENVTYPDLAQTSRAISLNPGGRVHANDAAVGNEFAVLSNTTWTASTSDGWISITDTTGGVVGDESGTVTYSIDANPAPALRTGAITISNGTGVTRTFTISQGAELGISPTTRAHDAASSGGHSIEVSGNVDWAADSDAGWLVITNGASGTGGGSVTYRLTENDSLAPRSGTIAVSGGGIEHILTVHQAGAAPYLAIAPENRDHDAAASSGHAIAVSGNIGWSAARDGDWISITAGDSGDGDGVVIYEVDANPDTSERQETITVAGGKRTWWFRVNQSAPPAYTIGGTVSGLAGSGLVLQNNDGDDLGVASDGNFSFETALPDGSEYNVTVLAQPLSPSQTCDVVNGHGIVDGEDVDDVQVDCTTDSFTVTTTATNGAITSPLNPIVEYDETTTVTGEADEHYYFASVSGCDGIEQSNSDQSVTDFSYETGAIVADCAVEAVFAIRTYTIEATVVSGQGSVEVQTPIVEHGGDATVESIAATGWSVAEVIGDNCIPTDTGDDIWTAADIGQDCAIEVSFVEDTTTELEASMSPAIAGMTVTYTITVTGTASAPSEGLVELVSDQIGPICTRESPDSISGNSSIYDCQYVWAESGTHELTASFGHSPTHGDSTDSRTENVLADEVIFSDRFEVQ